MVKMDFRCNVEKLQKHFSVMEEQLLDLENLYLKSCPRSGPRREAIAQLKIFHQFSQLNGELISPQFMQINQAEQ